jgi:hypothetical protein
MPVQSGVMSGNIVSGYPWNCVFDGAQIGCVMCPNVSRGSAYAHFHIDSSQSGTGRGTTNVAVVGNTGYGGGNARSLQAVHAIGGFANQLD